METQFKQLTMDLPAEPHGFLHILPGWLPLLLGLALILLLLATALWLFAYWYSRHRKKAKPPASFPAATTDIGREIANLRRRIQRSEDYREGCHLLSALLKQHLERKTGLEIEEMTAREIAQFTEGLPARFFVELSGLQFGRAEPKGDDFDRMVKLSDQLRKADVSLTRPAVSSRGRA